MIEKLWMQTSEWEKMGKGRKKKKKENRGNEGMRWMENKGRMIVCIETIGVEVEMEMEYGCIE